MASGIHDGVRNMTVDDFRQSLTTSKPPAKLTLALIGLWWDAKGDWTRVHESAQRDDGSEVRGCTPTCIARKPIMAVQPTGMGRQESLFAEKHLMRSGSAS
jgi:hypothetical protein